MSRYYNGELIYCLKKFNKKAAAFLLIADPVIYQVLY
jgi:hypothetical protein